MLEKVLNSTNGVKHIDTTHKIDKIMPSTKGRLFASGGTLSHIHLEHVQSLEQALKLMDSGGRRIISRVPIHDLTEHAGEVRGGVFDFCGTLITDSQWRAFEALMSDESRQRGTEAINWYHSARNNGSAPDDLDHPDWLLGAIMEENIAAVDASLALQPIMLAEKDGVHIEDVIDAGARLRPREGSFELIDVVGPGLFNTFGIEQMVQGWQEAHGVVRPIAAIRLGEDDRGQIRGFNMNLNLPMTKALAARRWRELAGLEPEQVLSIGDTIFDIHMMHPDGFNVLIVPPGELDRKVADFRTGQLAHMWKHLTMVLFDDSLLPLVDLIEEARADN